MNNQTLSYPSKSYDSHHEDASSIEVVALARSEPMAIDTSAAAARERLARTRAAAADLGAPTSRSELGELVDPTQFTRPLDITDVDADFLNRLLHGMRLIRATEVAIGTWVESDLARTPCHLGIGQEAVAVGVSAHLRRSDRVFGGHRSHAHYLAMGGDLYGLLAEVLGRADGASRGMGGSMHICAHSVGFHGAVPLVGATIPIAVGAALAAKMQGSSDVGVAYFGDGATEEGVLHESMNLASLYRLPVLFVCENNLFSSHLDINARQPNDRVARFAEAHHVPALTVDGNDVLAVSRAAAEALARARAGHGPGFLEAITYRHFGHVGYMDDIDVGVRRKMHDLLAWKKRDPIQRLEQAMLAAGVISAADLSDQQARLRAQIAAACERALAAPYPPQQAILSAVYREPPR
jgi:acetoin:2,6-dichlorophenolindophenol oxidoreductase subunit alpha